MKALLSIYLVSFFFIGGAIGQSLQKEPQRATVQNESTEKYEVKYETLLKKLEALEQSIAILRSEVIRLEDLLSHMQTRASLTTYKLPKEISLCGEGFPSGDKIVWENLDREFLLALSNEAQVLLWMKRARRYFPLIEEKLKEMRLPDDLKYVAIIESSLRPEAVSSSGAAGIWQFIPSTGEKYGMRKNRNIDERFDFIKATEGALSYLKTLYEEFRRWTLTMAAYNAGENRVRKEIELQKTRNYFYLDLPLETERYVYKIAVAKIILSDPGRFGCYLEEKELYHPLQLERVQIELPRPLPIIEVAGATGFSYKEIREMNPHLFEEAVPPGIHFINLPSGTTEKFWSFFLTWKKGAEGK